MRQAVSVRGQSAAITQPTHRAFASQVLAPPQFEPAGTIVCDGVPVMQMS
jgi:hypothetical protein